LPDARVGIIWFVAPTGPDGLVPQAFGLIVRFTARGGAEEALAARLREIDAVMRQMDGCLLHVVSQSRQLPAEFWITEVFRDRAAHSAALGQSSVRELAGDLSQLLAESPVRHETVPL
jgi:quinol monooxygenase YgiN